MHAQYSFVTELHILPCSHKISWNKRAVGPFWMSPAICDTPAMHHEITRSTQMYNFNHDDTCFIADIGGSLCLFPKYYVLYVLTQCILYVYG